MKRSFNGAPWNRCSKNWQNSQEKGRNGVNLDLQLPRVLKRVFLKNTSWLLLLEFTGTFELKIVFCYY